jgi:hypothetical protein
MFGQGLPQISHTLQLQHERREFNHEISLKQIQRHIERSVALVTFIMRCIIIICTCLEEQQQKKQRPHTMRHSYLTMHELSAQPWDLS